MGDPTTAAERPEPPAEGPRLCIVHVPHCPLVDPLRTEVEVVLERIGMVAPIRLVEGPCASPTLLVEGEEIDGSSSGADPACRVDLPSRTEILAYLRAAGFAGGTIRGMGA